MRFEDSYHLWLMRDGPTLFMDIYEPTMAQAYFVDKMSKTAYFEITVRWLPENWVFFVLAGLKELKGYIKEFRFAEAI
jgi:nicotinic acid phosphoribosyltransferase